MKTINKKINSYVDRYSLYLAVISIFSSNVVFNYGKKNNFQDIFSSKKNEIGQTSPVDKKSKH